jgi:hypothetical protein
MKSFNWEKITNWAVTIGTAVYLAVQYILTHKPS